jgi:FkbM family methyltransferase
MRRLRALGYYGYSVVEMLVHFKNWPSLVPLFFGRSSSRQKKLIIRRPFVEMIVRSVMDVWSVKETLIDAFYTRYGVPVQDGWTVVDIGAGIGDYCVHATYGNPTVNLYAFEPYPGSFTVLQRNLALNGIENVTAYQKAVWSKAGELQLNLAPGEPLQFNSQEPLPETPGGVMVTVESVSLEAVLSAEKIKKVDLLKMDCEGAEYEIFFGTPASTFNIIERIIMEYHDVDAEHTHSVLVRFLEDQGYRVTRHQNFVHKDIGYLFAQHDQ